jgi:hypothetical protein
VVHGDDHGPPVAHQPPKPDFTSVHWFVTLATAALSHL